MKNKFQPLNSVFASQSLNVFRISFFSQIPSFGPADPAMKFLLVEDFGIQVQFLSPDSRKIQIPGAELFLSIIAGFYWNITWNH